jgi:uncharacterized protein YndB with AHSA1/START domain
VPPEVVYDAWLDPQQASRFLFATASGEMIRAEIDARVGGAFNFTERRDGEDTEHIGIYHELERPRQIVFSFSVPRYSSEESRVSLEIEPTAEGCEVTLTAENVAPEWAERTQQGWTMILDNMAVGLEKNADEQ